MTLPRVLLMASLIPVLAFAPPPSTAPAPASETRSEPIYATAIGLFAGVEETWAASDAERLAALVDTTTVRIAIKPGTPLATASTRVAVAFLVQDQLRLVHTKSFRVTRFDCDAKRGLCRAIALWTGDWGGRQGTRTVRVALTARPQASRWLLTEIRAED
jgi:hypothetical protein